MLLYLLVSILMYVCVAMAIKCVVEIILQISKGDYKNGKD